MPAGEGFRLWEHWTSADFSTQVTWLATVETFLVRWGGSVTTGLGAGARGTRGGTGFWTGGGGGGGCGARARGAGEVDAMDAAAVPAPAVAAAAFGGPGLETVAAAV